jgi:DNA-binding NarL/FixJ family response regulator
MNESVSNSATSSATPIVARQPAIVILDDSAAWLGLAGRFIKAGLSEASVTGVTTEAEFQRRFEADGADLVILDVSLPGRNGIEILRDFKSKNPSIPAVILSMHDDEAYRSAARHAGAVRYVTKDEAGELLAEAIRSVMNGGKR